MKLNKLMNILLIIFVLILVKSDISAALALGNGQVVEIDNENGDFENKICISDTKKLWRLFIFGGDGNTKI